MSYSQFEFRRGDRVRVREEVATDFAGRIGLVTSGPDRGGGYFISVGTADSLWFASHELEIVARYEEAQRV